MAADIASPDLKSPSCQGLTLVSPGIRIQGSLNTKFHGIRGVDAGRCQDQVLAGRYGKVAGRVGKPGISAIRELNSPGPPPLIALGLDGCSQAA